MPPPPDLSSYRLTPAESRSIFTNNILPLDIAPIPPSPTPETPTAILAVGQTGAGKTRLSPVVLSAFDAAGRTPAHLIADVYKTHHPSYASIPPHLASAATGPDAREWLRMAVEEAAARRLDILLESACRHPEDFTSLASILRDASYRLTVLVMAVPAPLSRLGTLVRYYHDLPEARSRGLPLRLTPAKVHDDSYDGLAKAVEWLDKTGIADRVILLRRGNFIAHIQHKADGEGALRDSLIRERSRPLTSEERRVALDDLEKLHALAEASENFNQIKVLVEPLLLSTADQDASGYPILRQLRFHEDPADGDNEHTQRVPLFMNEADH